MGIGIIPGITPPKASANPKTAAIFTILLPQRSLPGTLLHFLPYWVVVPRSVLEGLGLGKFGEPEKGHCRFEKVNNKVKLFPPDF